MAAAKKSAPATASSMLAALTGSVAKTTVKKASKERPVMQLTPEVSALFAEFAPAKELFDVFEAKITALKGELNPELFSLWVETLWRNRAVPTNPALKAVTEDGDVCEGMFVVQERFMTKIPDNAEPAGSVAQLLTEMGLEAGDAESLVREEIDFAPQLGLRPFNELVTGHYEDKQLVEATAKEKEIGQKLLEFVTKNLTAEEQALVLQNTPKTVVKKGFLDRVCKYAHSKEQLASILKVMTPVVQLKGAKFATTASPVEKTTRLLEKASVILGSAEQNSDEE